MSIEQDTITVYEAIARMRKLSSQGQSFSLTHATYNRDEQSSHGLRHCHNAILRPAAKGDDITGADFKLFYIDQDNRTNRNCWQMLIMYFNGLKCILN